MGINLPQLAPASTDRVSGAQVIDGSLKLDSTSKTYFTKTFGTAGNRRTFTWSCWLKLADPGTTDPQIFGTYTDANNRAGIFFDSSEGYKFGIYSRIGGTTQLSVATDRVFRDYSGWTHFLINVDTTQSTSTNRVKIYINGEQQTALSQTTYPSQNYELDLNITSTTHYFNKYGGADYFVDGYASQFNFIDGQALDASYFGYTDPLTNTWRPKKFSGEYGTPIVYSTGISGSLDTSNGGQASVAFNGSIEQTNTNGVYPGSGTTATWTPANSALGTTLPYSSSARVYVGVDVNGDDGGLTVVGANGSQSISTGVGGNSYGWVDITAATSPITSIAWSRASAGSQGVRLFAVEVDGTILTDFDGQNSVYLPMDGNTPIGQDQSGRGNNWTPVNFGGSNTIEKATGALPILNTGNGGTVARAGVFGSEVGFRETVSSSSGGGNPYIFDTRGTQPTLSFIRGATYVFDYSSATSHPLRFATAADAAGSTEYTDGTSVSGNVISFTVPHNAPDTLYYYCTNHSGMGNSISVTTDTKKADPYAWKNVLAMPLVGGSGSDSSDQVNCNSSAKTITTGGSPAEDKDSTFYGSCTDFSASSTTGFYPTGAQSDLTFGTNDFTIEFWFKPTTTSRQYMTDFRNNGSGSGSGNNKPFVIFADNGSDGTGTRIRYANDTSSPNMDLLGGVGLPPSNTWNHLAIVRSSGTVYGYLNGVLHNSATDNTNYSTNDSVTIGNSSGVSLVFAGSLQDYRVYNGVAKYTSNFIPASTNPDILPDTPSGVATKTQLTKITDGAVSFDGTGDYLSGFGGSALLPTSTGTAFVVDCFWSSSGNTTQKGIWEQHSGGSGRTAYFVNNGTALFLSEGNTVGSFTYADNRWYFTRIIYDGSGNIYHYVDGVLIGSGTQTVGVDDTGFQIGAYSTDCFNGHISNFRIVVGSNSLSGTDVPTSPLTNITNTTLLCCQSNTSATAAAVTPGTITANGDAAATNFNPFTTDINTVRGQKGTYATWNPLAMGSNLTLEDGNLSVRSTSNNWLQVKATTYVSSGRWYWESTVNPATTYTNEYHGISDDDESPNTNLGTVSGYCYGAGGDKYTTGTNAAGAGDSYGVGDTIGIALDLDSVTKTITYYKNNVQQFSQTITTSGPWHPASNCYYNQTMPVFFTNFGQKPFKFPPPDGYQPLTSSTVRPDTVVPRPDKYVAVTTYSGNATTQHIDVGLRPDFVWIKERTDTGGVAHYLGDTVRGINKNLSSDQTVSEGTDHVYGYVSSVDDKGFTVTQGSNDSFYTNGSPETYVAWTWKAGGNKNTYNVDDVGYANASDINMSIGDLMNNSQDWSGNATGGANVGNAFDGTGPRKDHYSHTSGSLTVNFSPAISGRIVVYGGAGGAGARTFTLSDGSVLSSGLVYDTAPYYETLDFGVKSNITSLTCSNGYALYAMSLDGKLLVDSGSSNSVPRITPTGASVGTKQGFSIIGFQGNATNNYTIPHGLDKVDFMIFKNRIDSVNWIVWHKDLGGGDKVLELNTTDAINTTTTPFNSIAPTPYVINLGTNNATNGNGDNMICYAWHDVPGLQKFGSYTAGSEPFVELGFKPAIVMIKCIGTRDTTFTSWYIADKERSQFNPSRNPLWANKNASEGKRGDGSTSITNPAMDIDLLSNGFRIKDNGDQGDEFNYAGSTYMYAAWAESPTFNLFGASANAR